MVLAGLGFLAACAATTLATPVLYDGRAPLNYTSAQINVPSSPYVYVVKGSKAASQYVSFDPKVPPPTPLWYSLKNLPKLAGEQTVSVKIDNSSVFVPGGNPANSQYGFRRTEIIAQNNRTMLETGKSVWHFSVMPDSKRPLNYKHEYQIVFIEPDDGTQVFRIKVGSSFTIPTASQLPSATAHNIEVLDHALNVLHSTPFVPLTWHNFAIQVDWDARTLGVFASKGVAPLKKVSKLAPNNSTKPGAAGQGDFHFGLLKLPLADPKDTESQQTDVVHRGIQEGTLEGLYYSGVFVESAAGGVSAGYGTVIPAF
ncbi:glycoside hydrolase family 131 protein [Ceratobasidium sp. AG-Ba]|nr:glycoside hydrolase family 131 protein [Ceratobasidium sp. AG-Ba]